MSSPSDLVTLTQVKARVNNTGVNDDALVSQLITSISRAMINATNRTGFLPRQYSEILNGNGKGVIQLKNWPVWSISSLSVNGLSIAAAPAFSAGVSQPSGYRLEASDIEPPGSMQRLFLSGSCFVDGVQNVSVMYNAGYQINAEAQTVPAGAPPAPVPVSAPYGAWTSDVGAIYATTGLPLVKVGTAPMVGQYSVSAGAYQFAAADAGASILITYGYVPTDLANLAMEWVAERYKYRDRIGLNSKSLGGQETISFQANKVPAYIMAGLQQYTRVVPC